MKILLTYIIASICFFSIGNITNAAESKEWFIEQLLNLNHWVEEYDITLAHLDPLFFSDPETREMYETMKQINKALRAQIIDQYRNKELQYPEIWAIVSAHKKFIFYTNRLFYYISLKEQGQSYGELDDAVLKSYKNVRIYYRKIKYLTLKR